MSKSGEASANAATDTEWAEFEAFVSKDDASKNIGEENSATVAEDVQPENDNQNKNDDKIEEFQQAAYGARFASLLMKREIMQKKNKTFSKSSSGPEEQSMQDMYFAPSLAFDEDGNLDGAKSLEEKIDAVSLPARKRQKIEVASEDVDELDWRSAA